MAMSSDFSAGSYDFTALGVESGELERLQLQARRSAELELRNVQTQNKIRKDDIQCQATY